MTPADTKSFRYNQAINGRQETLTIGRYASGGVTLADAREKLAEAKKAIAAGKSPAKEKARDKAHRRRPLHLQARQAGRNVLSL